MATYQLEDKCALPRCTCTVLPGERYCCEECRRMHADPDSETIECPCGQAECASDGPSGGVTL